DLKRVLFAPGGTSAIGMALKLARVATGRFKFVSMWDSFHGASLDAISVGGEADFRGGIGPLIPGCEHVPPPDYWKRVRAACDKHGTLLILDEIPTGLGRTGRMFACEHYDIVPDMLVLGKGLGGGVFPLAALIAREGLNVAAEMALGHYTHEKNPVACAAGLATLQVIEDEKLVEHARVLGESSLERMRKMARRHPIIGDVRGIGLLMGMELLRGRNPPARATDEAERVMYSALSRGLNFKITMGNILTLTPALTISREEMDQALTVLEASIGDAEKGRGQ